MMENRWGLRVSRTTLVLASVYSSPHRVVN
jgi:hypothetical protein